MHPLTLLAFGMYGELLPNQNGAPVRIVVPWKYGFRAPEHRQIPLHREEPATAWNKAARNEYGFIPTSIPTWITRAGARPPSAASARAACSPEAQDLTCSMATQAQVGQLYAGMDLKSSTDGQAPGRFWGTVRSQRAAALLLLHPAAKPLLHSGLLPLAWLVYAAAFDHLGANPAEALIRSLGGWTLRPVPDPGRDPLRQMLANLPRWRAFGACWASYCDLLLCLLHLLATAGIRHGAGLARYRATCRKRPFILVGICAFALLLLLAATSFQSAITTWAPRVGSTLHGWCGGGWRCACISSGCGAGRTACRGGCVRRHRHRAAAGADTGVNIFKWWRSALQLAGRKGGTCQCRSIGGRPARCGRCRVDMRADPAAAPSTSELGRARPGLVLPRSAIRARIRSCCSPARTSPAAAIAGQRSRAKPSPLSPDHRSDHVVQTCPALAGQCGGLQRHDGDGRPGTSPGAAGRSWRRRRCRNSSARRAWRYSTSVRHTPALPPGAAGLDHQLAPPKPRASSLASSCCHWDIGRGRRSPL